MVKKIHIPLLLLFFLCMCNNLCAQVKPAEDSFFLLKKKGLLKRLGESIYVADITDYAPVKSVNPFEQYKGKVIVSINIAKTGFYNVVRDTANGDDKSVGQQFQDFFHINTKKKVLAKNLFFEVGDRVLPLLFSDNERFLREQSFFQDALIKVVQDSLDESKVHVYILSRDVFSIGASVDISNPKKAEMQLQDENLFGSGNRLEVTGLYDKEREPNYGLGALLTQKNIAGSFINWNTGFRTYNNSFNTGRQQETAIFTTFEKGLISRYSAWMGAAQFSYNTTNYFYKDVAQTTYEANEKYSTLTTDLWAGLNIGYKNNKETDNDKRLRHFVALRLFENNFFRVPDNYLNTYSPQYADIGGTLASYTLYKQNFYNTNFIYGFGRREDIPQGLSATIVSGYTEKNSLRRVYYSTEFEGTKLTKIGNFLDFTFKAGGFVYKNKLEDAVLQAGVSGFTGLKKLSSKWRNRNFIRIDFTKLYNVKLGFPIVLESDNGLPYFKSVGIAADTRGVLKFESVYYNLKKILGFRIAPFFFTDFALVKPLNEPYKNAKGFTALGGGIRTRNEHLVFGTIELKGYYFPRVDVGIKNWRVDLTSKLTFRFNSNFLRRPDFINGN